MLNLEYLTDLERNGKKQQLKSLSEDTVGGGGTPGSRKVTEQNHSARRGLPPYKPLAGEALRSLKL